MHWRPLAFSSAASSAKFLAGLESGTTSTPEEIYNSEMKRKVIDRIERQRLHRGNYRMNGAKHKQQRVAVWRRLGHCRGRQCSCRTRLIDHQDALTHVAAHDLGVKPRHGVGSAARRLRTINGDRFGRIGLRFRAGGAPEHQSDRERGRQNRPNAVHD